MGQPCEFQVDDGLGRRWMWAHHISSAARRGLIVKEARALNLGGYLKPGYPGVVVVEGASGNLEDFVDWMKTSSKHTQAVRGQVDAPGRALARSCHFVLTGRHHPPGSNMPAHESDRTARDQEGCGSSPPASKSSKSATWADLASAARRAG